MVCVFSCLTLCYPMECSPPGSSAHGILQARILARGAIPFSRGSSQPRNQTHISWSPALAGGFFTTSTSWRCYETEASSRAHLGGSACSLSHSLSARIALSSLTVGMTNLSTAIQENILHSWVKSFVLTCMLIENDNPIGNKPFNYIFLPWNRAFTMCYTLQYSCLANSMGSLGVGHD